MRPLYAIEESTEQPNGRWLPTGIVRTSDGSNATQIQTYATRHEAQTAAWEMSSFMRTILKRPARYRVVSMRDLQKYYSDTY